MGECFDSTWSATQSDEAEELSRVLESLPLVDLVVVLSHAGLSVHDEDQTLSTLQLRWSHACVQCPQRKCESHGPKQRF